MLLGGIILFSLLFAGLVCAGTGAFGGLHWLWILPVSWLGFFLVLLAAAFLFLYVMCRRVDLNREQTEDSPFYRKMTAVYIEFIVQVARVRIRTTGMERLPKEGRFLLVCNHLHNVDPGILLHQFRNSQLAFISKQENRDMFLVGKIMHKLQCQMINRENDREALKTILKCIQIIREDKASIAVFPEGYCSKDGLLQHFRSGVFKIALKTGVPIVVCTLRNTKTVVSNLMHLKPSDVELHLVAVIPPEELKGVTATEVGERVHRLMAEDLGPALVARE